MCVIEYNLRINANKLSLVADAKCSLLLAQKGNGSIESLPV